MWDASDTRGMYPTGLRGDCYLALYQPPDPQNLFEEIAPPSRYLCCCNLKTFDW